MKNEIKNFDKHILKVKLKKNFPEEVNLKSFEHYFLGEYRKNLTDDQKKSIGDLATISLEEWKKTITLDNINGDGCIFIIIPHKYFKSAIELCCVYYNKKHISSFKISFYHGN